MTKLLLLKQNFGLLTIKGEDLRINKLSIDTSEVIVEGDICDMSYTQKELDKKISVSVLDNRLSGKVTTPYNLLGKIFK